MIAGVNIEEGESVGFGEAHRAAALVLGAFDGADAAAQAAAQDLQ